MCLQALYDCCLGSLVACLSGLAFTILFCIAILPRLEEQFKQYATAICVAIWLVFTSHLLCVIWFDRNSISPVSSLYVMLYGALICYTLLPWRWEWACIASVLSNATHLIFITLVASQSLEFRTYQVILYGFISCHTCVIYSDTDSVMAAVDQRFIILPFMN